jgi:hypothetical protein
MGLISLSTTFPRILRVGLASTIWPRKEALPAVMALDEFWLNDVRTFFRVLANPKSLYVAHSCESALAGPPKLEMTANNLNKINDLLRWLLFAIVDYCEIRGEEAIK